jgi:hypothetical protein
MPWVAKCALIAEFILPVLVSSHLSMGMSTAMTERFPSPVYMSHRIEHCISDIQNCMA